jgi:hypothetical protein
MGEDDGARLGKQLRSARFAVLDQAEGRKLRHDPIRLARRQRMGKRLDDSAAFV